MNKTKKIVLTGPESVGKSTLTRQLAEYFKMPYVTELAREYISKLNRPYTKVDVLEIAHLQIQAENDILQQQSPMIFFDTDLIITKIWLLHVYNDCPNWIEDHLKKNPADLHLLCYYDLPWEADPLRENPLIRPLLYEKYKQEIENYKINYGVVDGVGKIRFNNALNIVNSIIGK